jgi:hypothetical protein
MTDLTIFSKDGLTLINKAKRAMEGDFCRAMIKGVPDSVLTFFEQNATELPGKVVILRGKEDESHAVRVRSSEDKVLFVFGDKCRIISSFSSVCAEIRLSNTLIDRVSKQTVPDRNLTESNETFMTVGPLRGCIQIHFCSYPLRSVPSDTAFGKELWIPIFGSESFDSLESFIADGGDDILFREVERLMVDKNVAVNVTRIDYVRPSGQCSDYKVVFNRSDQHIKLHSGDGTPMFLEWDN